MRTSAAGDENFVRSLCRKESIDLYCCHARTGSFKHFPADGKKTPLSKTVRPLQKLAQKPFRNFENWARLLRYAFFEYLIEKYSFDVVAVGSNANDQAETVLMKFLRGSGIDGLAGMKYRRENIVRPLLDVNREKILAYLKKNKLAYCTDETNADTRFTRNRIRHRLLPLIKEEYNPNIVATICTTAKTLQELKSFFAGATDKLISQATVVSSKDFLVIDWKKIKDQQSPLTASVLRRIIKIVRGNLTDIKADTIIKTIHYLNNPQNKAEFREITRLTIAKNNGTVSFKLSK